MAHDTIFALSSGPPPAAISIIRVSGPKALETLRLLARTLPEPRRATLTDLSVAGTLLDRALVVRFDAPHTVTGEDLVELHLHGGRAVVAAVSIALAECDGLRAAEPGEFTRRAFENGRIDLAEAEGLADLLAAETESQRRSALLLAGGALSRQVEEWTRRLLRLAADIEARLDFSDEGDVSDGLGAQWQEALCALSAELGEFLGRPPAERLRDGVRVVIAGPPNVGKSTLFNALIAREAAITSPMPGTTRDVIEAPIALSGLPFVFIDTAGLRGSEDDIEAIGVARAQSMIDGGDLVLWLGEVGAAPNRAGVLTVRSYLDLWGPAAEAGHSVSGLKGDGVGALLSAVVAAGRALLPREGEISANARQRSALTDCSDCLGAAAAQTDLLVIAEELRRARTALDRITGRAGVEDMLDSLFGRFCIGK